jgi:hypothetical protein
MPKSKARKKIDENFKVAAVQRLQTGDVLANDLANETSDENRGRMKRFSARSGMGKGVVPQLR